MNTLQIPFNLPGGPSSVTVLIRHIDPVQQSPCTMSGPPETTQHVLQQHLRFHGDCQVRARTCGVVEINVRLLGAVHQALAKDGVRHPDPLLHIIVNNALEEQLADRGRREELRLRTT